RVLAVAIGRESRGQVEAGLATGDDEEDCGPCHCSGNLRNDVGCELVRRKAARGPQATRDCRVEVPAGNRTEGVCHRQHGKTEREGDPGEADSDIGKSGSKHGTAAPAQYQPKRSDELSNQLGDHSGTPWSWGSVAS